VSQKIEALGVEYLRQLIAGEQKRLVILDDEIRRLHSLEETRRTCLLFLDEYKTMLADYSKITDEAYAPDWFYTVARYPSELPMDTRVKVVAKNEHHHQYEGREGKVVGYRCCPGAIYPDGWHYIAFDDDLTNYANRISMPYVHRTYLQVIE
jgi:hypothetical protein